MKRSDIIEQIKSKASFLCVGLDTDINKIPEHLRNTSDPIFAFNKEIIDQTSDLCVSYKLNLAFYESMGIGGMEAMMRTMEYIPDSHFIIADAKRGDIGNTAAMYAKAFFEVYKADAVTIAPYMGEDSVRPFLDFREKWAIVLGLTSNQGAADFQFLDTGDGELLYQRVIRKVSSWGSTENTMFVVGGTKADHFSEVRKIIPEHFLLVPGVGVQGGDLHSVCEAGLNEDVSLLVNSSRGIIYSSSGNDFGSRARDAASQLQKSMETELRNKGLI